MATSEERKQRIAALVSELAEVLGDVDESLGDCWLDAVENQAIEIGDAVSVELTRQVSQRRPREKEANCPQCNQAGHYRQMRERELIGRRGPVLISEPEYFCPCCRKAFFPSDAGDRR